MKKSIKKLSLSKEILREVVGGAIAPPDDTGDTTGGDTTGDTIAPAPGHGGNSF